MNPKNNCRETHCGEDDCAEEKGVDQPGQALLHCGEENCGEESCAEEDCGEEVEDVAISIFITQMAYLLLEGRITPDDILEGMLLKNCGDIKVAYHIRDRAVAEAALYRGEGKELN